MTEADITGQIVQMMNLTISGISVFVTIVSAYIVAVFFFLHRAPIVLKLVAFLFFTLAVAFLMLFMRGSFDHAHALQAALVELNQNGGLSPVGRAALARGVGAAEGIDTTIQHVMWGALGLVYVVLFYLTFLHRWKHD
jgi:hypothetical protein